MFHVLNPTIIVCDHDKDLAARLLAALRWRRSCCKSYGTRV